MALSCRRLDVLIWSLFVLSFLYYILSAYHIPISFDEAKYYLVIKKVSEGLTPWKDIQGGSNSALFYYIHSFWVKIFGVDFFISRILNIILNFFSFYCVIYIIRRYLDSKYHFLIIAFFLLYILNPFFVSNVLEVNHYAFSNAFMIFCSSFAGLYFLKKRMRRPALLTFCFTLGFIMPFPIIIRNHLGLLIFIPFLLFLIKENRERFFASSIFYSLGVLVNISVFEDYLSHFVLKTYDYLAFFLQENFGISLKRIRVIDSLGQELLGDEEIVGKVNDILGIGGSFIHGKFQFYHFARSISHHILGTELGALIFYIFLFSSISLLSMKNYKDKAYQLIAICFSVTFFPLLFLRYYQTTTFNYFYQSMFFATLLSLYGVKDLVFSNIFKEPTKAKQFVLLAITCITFQTLIFNIPKRILDNPTLSIFRGYGRKPNKRHDSPYNVKALAKHLNQTLSPEDYVFTGFYAPLIYLKSKSIPNTEMNYYSDFFKYDAWAIERSYKVPSKGSVPVILNQYMYTKKVKYIVDAGWIHEDLYRYLDGIYCFKENFMNWKIYEICQSGNN